MSLFWAQWVGNFEKPNGQSGTIATVVGIVIIKGIRHFCNSLYHLPGGFSCQTMLSISRDREPKV